MRITDLNLLIESNKIPKSAQIYIYDPKTSTYSPADEMLVHYERVFGSDKKEFQVDFISFSTQVQ